MTGWIKAHRQLMSNGLWSDKPFARGQAWIDILLNTSYEKSSFWVRGIEIILVPGQCAMSQETMSNRWGWSRKKVSNFLKHLETAHQIEHQKTNATTLITVKKWEVYQQKEQQKAPQENSKGTPEEHIKEVKNLRSEEKTLKTPDGEDMTFAEIKKIYASTFGGSLLPPKHVLDRLQWIIDKFDKDYVLTKFEGAYSAKAKSLNYITVGLRKEIEGKSADDQMWADMEERNGS